MATAASARLVCPSRKSAKASPPLGCQGAGRVPRGDGGGVDVEQERPRANWLPTWLYSSRRISPPNRNVCLPRIHEKLSMNWSELLLFAYGPSESSPNPL